MNANIPETPVIDPWENERGQEGEKRSKAGGGDGWALIIVMLGMAAIGITAAAAGVFFSTAEDSAGGRAVKSAIEANRQDVAAQLVLRSLEKAEVSPDRAELYARSAQGAGLTVGRCREESTSRYTATYSCRLELHVANPHRITVTGEYWSLVERKKGVNWPFVTTLPVLDHGHDRYSHRPETYGRKFKDL